MSWGKTFRREENYNYPFNMGIQWLRDSADICFRITEARQQDDMLSWFILLWDLIDRMSFEMEEKEKEQIIKKLEEVKNLLNVPPAQLPKVLGMNKPVVRQKLSDTYKEYLKLLNNKERIFKKKRTAKSWEEGLNGDF